MEVITVMTKIGSATLSPGEVFQAFDSGKSACKYQYIGLLDGVGEKNIYLHDETNGKFCEVSRSWFVNRSVRKIGGN